MPAKSPAQLKLMQAVAHNPEFAKKVGIPQKVGVDFASKPLAGPGVVRKVTSALRTGAPGRIVRP